MTTLPTPTQIASLDDERLEELCKHWRGRALRGDTQAFGVAHLHELERHRRQRESRLQPLEPRALQPAAPKPWWKSW